MARLNVNPARVLDSNAHPVSGGTRTVYLAGTTTPVTTYSDIAFTTPHPQAIPADAAGFFPEIYLPPDQEYKIVDRDGLGASVWTGDRIRPEPSTFAYKTATDLIASPEKSRGLGAIWEAGGHRYEEVTSGQDFTTEGLVKLKALPGPLGKNLRALGAAGDGVTNDKALIDTHNVAGTQIDLDGATYAYTGSFVPAAHFVNGQIVSSDLGTFDYRTQTYSASKTVTVGPGQTLTTLAAALNWLKDIRFTDLTLTLSGDHNIADVNFGHPDSARLNIIGTAMSGAMPTKADMVGTRATDEALIAGRFTASIDVGGTGDSTTGGAVFPNGLGLLENICVKSNTRYSLSVGFNESHFASTPGQRLRLANVAVVGGVWGIVAVGVQLRIRSGTRTFFAYQNTGTQPGGPLDLIDTHARFEGMYAVYSAGQSSKYGLYCEGKSVVVANNNTDITGPFLNGIMAKEGAKVSCDGLITDGVSQPITALSGAQVDSNGYVFSNGDVANTNTLAGAAQEGWGDNNSANAVVFAGGGASVALSDGTMENMVAGYAFHAVGGVIWQGTGTVAVNNCKWTVAFSRFYTSAGNYLAFEITNPKAGSLDQSLAYACSTIRLGTNSGSSFSPAINTMSNGNLFATTG